MPNEIPAGSKVSAYKPSEEVCKLSGLVQRDVTAGETILNRQWPELNNRSVIEDENRGKLMFNAFVDTSIDDPAEAWKWRGTRSKARNKGIATHANLTAQFLMPSFLAQNENDDIDQEFSEIMREIVEWLTSPTNSNYQSSFLSVTLGMMSNPVTYMGAEYVEVMQKIREKKEDGGYEIKEILDEVLSGFSAPIWGSSEILITNAYERQIQRQRAIVKRRFVEKFELEAKYGDHPNWPYVQAGQRAVYNTQDGLFYDVKDIENQNLCQEVVWENRREDAGVPFVNGIYLGDQDVDNNPIAHRDNRGAPKYNVVPFGYNRIGEHFFYWKSLMNIVGWDNEMYDAMTEMVMNRTMLEVDPPVAISGSDKVDSDIVFPKSVVAFEDPKTRVTNLLPSSNLSAGFSTLADIDRSMSEESIDPVSSGNIPPGEQKAFVVATTQAAAKKILSEVAKPLSLAVAEFGDLMKDIIVNHITVPQVEELTGGTLRLKYRSFLLENKQLAGRSVSKKLVFDQDLIGAEMTAEEKEMASLKLLEETGWPDTKLVLSRVNPALFRSFKYLARSDVEEIFSKNNEAWQPVLTNLYTTLRNDPYVDQEGLARRLMRSYFNSEGDSLMRKQPAAMPGAPEGAVPPAGGMESKVPVPRTLSTPPVGVPR